MSEEDATLPGMSKQRFVREKFRDALYAWKRETGKTQAHFSRLLRDEYGYRVTPQMVSNWALDCLDGPLDKTWVPDIEKALGLPEGGLGE